ncbi:tetratricopeptide repeat protein, partial [Acidobacteria bacterium AH-259-D05]|nr:tetratricopeptide repeat protein [Acidobacteria bacterium AH-259-D05]
STDMSFRFLLVVAVLGSLSCGGPGRISKLPVPRENVLKAYRLMAEGDELALAGRPHFALLKYLDASRLNPYHEVIFNKLAIAYSRLNQFRQAEEAVKRSIRLEPDYAFAHNTRGIVHLANQYHKQAIGSFKRAIKLRPEEANFYVNLGHAYLRDDKYEEGLRTYRRALELDPEILGKSDVIELSYQSPQASSPERFYQMARIFAELGDKEVCLEYLGKALSAGFSDGRRLMRDAAFERLREDTEFMDLIALYGINGTSS